MSNSASSFFVKNSKKIDNDGDDDETDQNRFRRSSSPKGSAVVERLNFLQHQQQRRGSPYHSAAPVEVVKRQNSSSINPHSRNFDINLYATKKSAAQGLLDLALLMANASQLKHIILTEGDHRFYSAMLALLAASITLQIMVAVGLLFLARIRIYDYYYFGRMAPADEVDHVVVDVQERENEDDDAETDELAASAAKTTTTTTTRRKAERFENTNNNNTEEREAREEERRIRAQLRRADLLNNLIVAGIFILTVINVFISAFGLNESSK